MDKNKNKSMLENLKTTISGYSIEIGNTTYNNSLEERIQAAKVANSIAKQAHKPKEKLSVPKRNIVVENMTIKKSNNCVQVPEFKKRNKQRWSSFKTDFGSSSNCTPFVNSSINRNINSSLQIGEGSTSFKSTNKGSMQHRLEAIKSNKKINNLSSTEHNTSSTLESFNPSKNVCPRAFTKNLNNNQIDTYSKPNEDQHHNTLVDGSNNSIQNRLIKAKEEMMVKSKFYKQIDVNKTEVAKKLPESGNMKLQDTHSLINNQKHKMKRLTSTNESFKKKLPLSTIKTIKSNYPNNNKLVDNKELITVQVKPNSISSNPETIVSSKLENQNVSKESKQRELDSFSFVLPKTFSVQQRLENKKKDPNNYLNAQFNNDNSMEWEEVEPNNIVNTVNDLRKTTREYEPMEWIPDSVMYCDEINCCLVIDTNILLLDLNSISIALDQFFPDYGYLTLVLPWQVFQELDCIKKLENQLGFRARQATRWVLDKFSIKHPRLKGQPMTNKEGESNDDAILKCAINIKDRVNHVSLITDDKILSIKSEVNGIPAKNSKWLQQLVSSNYHEESSNNIFLEAVKKYPVIDSKLIMEFEPNLEHFIERVLKFAVKEFWNIIAPQKLLKFPQKQLESVLWFFMHLQSTSPEINLKWTELYDFLKYCFEMINDLPYEYHHITDALLNDLMKAKQYLKQNMDYTVPNEPLIITQLDNLKLSGGSIPDIENILHNILSEVQSFCASVYEVNGFHHNATEKQINGLCLKSEDFNKATVESYSYKLSNIIKAMLKIKKYKTEQLLQSDIIIKEFLEAIVEFNSKKYQHLQKDNVIDYCLMKEKNMFMKILLFFQNNLSALKNLITIMKY